MDQPEIVANTQSHRATVIWLHGLGADGTDFVPIVPELHLPYAAHIKFIFPHAPIRPVTLNGGMPMRAWFDIDELSLDVDVDYDDIFQAYHMVSQLIDQEIESGIDSENIVLAGFSQGGALALMIALKYPHQLGAIIGLSCFLPDSDRLKSYTDHQQQTTPTFLGHGTQDLIVPLSLGIHTRDKLQDLGFQVEWHQYDMPHSVCPQELADLGEFLKDFGK